MNINWTIITPIIATLIAPLLAVMLQEIFVRARANPKRKELEQKTAQTHIGKRFLYWLFPPDVRLLLMPITFIGSYLLSREMESSQPLTRLTVLKIVGLVGVLIANLFADVLIGTYKVFAASDAFKQLAATKTKSLEPNAPANNALHLTAGSVPVKKSSSSKSKASRGGR